MMGRITRARRQRVTAIAATLGASVAAIGETNKWDVLVAGQRAGAIRYDSRARVWLATTGTEATIGDLVGCLQFVIRRYWATK